MPNIEELRRVQKHLRTHPEMHDQGTWGEIHESKVRLEDGELEQDHWNRLVRATTLHVQELDCGTTACLAGWTCLLNGYDPVIGPETEQWKNSEGTIVFQSVTDGEKVYSVAEKAQELLGLRDSERNYLFGAISKELLHRHIDIVCDGGYLVHEDNYHD